VLILRTTQVLNFVHLRRLQKNVLDDGPDPKGQ